MAGITGLTTATTTLTIDPIADTGGTTRYKRALAPVSATGLDSSVASQAVGTHVDDAAATLATDAVVGIGALADETATDSVDEGDVGLVRMTLDRILRVVSQQRSSTATKATVAASASSVTLLAANTARRGAIIVNDSTVVLYIDLTGGTASTSSYSAVLGGSAAAPFEFYEVPFGYNGLITGIWASATGNARVTEFVA